MLKNLIRVAIRNLTRDTKYSLLNIAGLTLGITFSLFLLFYIKDELGYDKYNKNADRIYRIVSYIEEPTKVTKAAVTQFPLAPTLKREYPEVEEAVRVIRAGGIIFKKEGSLFSESNIWYADSNYFEVFTGEFIGGDPKTALSTPASIVITETFAKRYFGGSASDAIGKVLKSNNGDIYNVTGVIKDPPPKAHLIYDGLISMISNANVNPHNWGGLNCYSYVLLPAGTNVSVFEKRISVLYGKYMASVFSKSNMKIRNMVQPITEIHLHSDLTLEPGAVGSISSIYIFFAVAVLLLGIACINYMNLATARSARRSKEIGIRKVVGSLRRHLVIQFLIESILLTTVSLFFSLILIFAFLNLFNSIAGKDISVQSLLQQGDTFVILVAVILFVGLVSGSYPALYLSKFNPVSILKGGDSPKGVKGQKFRKILLVFQFAISITMIICTAVIYRQLQYIRNKDLGFNKEHLISMNIGDDAGRMKLQALRDELKRIPAIISISTSQRFPGQLPPYNLYSVETNNGFIEKGIDHYRIDEEYIPTLGMKVIQGRNFSSSGSDSSNGVIVNEKLVAEFGWTQPIGKRIARSVDTAGGYYSVIGVVNDFNQNSLYKPITPLFLLYKPGLDHILIRISTKDVAGTVAEIGNKWKEFFPDLMFKFSFLDEDFDAQYNADKRRNEIFVSFSILAIILTCMGVLGLVAFMTEQRRKEISIRKITGAGVGPIIFLLLKSFILLIFISWIIAIPIAYYLMHQWLQIFSFRANLSAWAFIYSGVIVMGVTLLTAAFHTTRAALANPVKNLRRE
jgi:putative ABC transport system permease protein